MIWADWFSLLAVAGRCTVGCVCENAKGGAFGCFGNVQGRDEGGLDGYYSFMESEMRCRRRSTSMTFTFTCM